MRILTLTNLYPNPYQPHRAPFNRLQLRHLAARHPVAVVAPIHWTDEAAGRRREGNLLPGGRRVVRDGMTVDHPVSWFPPRVLRSWYGGFYRWSVRRAFGRALAEFRPDLVFAPWVYPDGLAAVELGHRQGLPVVLKAHGSDVLLVDRYPGRRRGTAEALRKADGLVVVSRDLADRAVALGADPARVRVVYNGVDGSAFHPGPRAEARARLGIDPGGAALLFVGNLVPVKGPDVLVEALGALTVDGPPFTCYMIGEGPLAGRLDAEVARLGLRGRVVRVGARPHAELPDWFRAADLVVVPSRSEGVPNVLLEASACGTPFVASRVGGIPEVAHLGTGRLVPPGDPARLAEAVRQSLAEPHGPGGVGGPRSHDDAVSEIVGLFEEVLRSAGPSGLVGRPGEVAAGTLTTPAA